MYSCSTVQWCFCKRAFNGGTGYMYILSEAESMQPEHKVSKKSQQEITVQYLNLINHYADTIFILSDLRTGQGLSSELEDKKIFRKICIN